MSNHVFIGLGNWDYTFEKQLSIDEVREGFEQITSYFTTKLGYRRELAHLSANPTSIDMLSKLDPWFASKERQPDDWIVLFYTGHGKLEANDDLYLLTSNYKNDLTPSTAFPAALFASMLVSRNDSGEDRRAQRVLLILDTCYSGAAAISLAASLRSRFSPGPTGPMFYVFAAALPVEEAIAGTFAKALISTLDNPALGGVHQQFLYFDDVIANVNKILGRGHRAVRLALDSPDETPQFFPNPRQLPNAHFGATVAEIRTAFLRNEYDAHWNPVARGVEFATQTGDYFTGRANILNRLTDWLQNPSTQNTHIITGAPGSGKSAILSRILMNSPVENPTVDVAIHARGKTLMDVVARFAQKLLPQEVFSEKTQGVTDSDAIVEALGSRQQPFRVLIDALDEASEPALIVAEFLRPLRGLPQVKLLVATRPEWLPALGRDAVTYYVDSPEYLSQTDIARFVEARLADIPGDHHALAEAVAAKSYPNFLIARLVAEDLHSRPVLPRPDEIDLPDSVGLAFENFLNRFDENRQRVRDLLTALAWTEGDGLPWNAIWAPVANAICDTDRYGNSDVEWLLEHAGSFIVEVLEEGRSVYRLYHQALADHLRRPADAPEIQKKITSALLRTVPKSEGGREWTVAVPYLRMHLAAHAAAGGSLGELMEDPGFLLVADSTRLLTEISSTIAPLPTDVVRAYKAASLHIRTRQPAEAASYLALAFRQSSSRLRAMTPAESPWIVPWAHWVPRAANNRIASSKFRVTALMSSVWTADRPVAIVGRKNGDVEVWEIATNKLLSIWHSDAGEVKILAVALTIDGPLVVAVRSDTVLTVHDGFSDRSTTIETRTDDRESITSMIITDVNGSWICVTAHYHLRLTIWNLPDLSIRTQKLNATRATIYSICAATYRDRPVLISGGDNLAHEPRSDHDDSTLRIWSLDDLSLIWEDGRGLHQGYIEHVAVGTIGKSQFILANGILKGEIWNLDETSLVYDGRQTTKKWFTYHRAGKDFFLTADYGKLEVFDLSLNRISTLFSRGASSRTFDLGGNYLTDIVRSQGQDVLLDASGDHVRVWALGELLAEGPYSPKLESYRSLKMAGASTLVAEVRDSESGSVAFLHPSTGEKASRNKLPNIEKDDQQSVDVVAEIAHDAVTGAIFVATTGGKILKVDVSDPSGFKTVVTVANIGGGSITRFQTARWRDQLLGFTTGTRTYRDYCARIWNLDTGAELFTDRQFELSHGEQDKDLTAVAVAEFPDDVRFAFAGQYGKIMVASLVAKPEGFYPVDFDTWPLPFRVSYSAYTRALAAGREGLELLLVAATENGDIAIFDFFSGDCLAQRSHAHQGEISALALGTQEKMLILSGGSSDGFARIWNSNLELLTEIEISEPIASVAWLDEKRFAVGTSRGVLAIELSKVLVDVWLSK